MACNALMVYIILAVLQPFGTNDDSNSKYLIFIGYALITAIGTFIPLFIIPLFSKSFYDPEKWTTGKSFVSYFFAIVLIIAGNTAYNCFLGNSLSTGLLITSAWQTLLVFLGVYAFIIWWNNRIMSKNLRQLIEVNKNLERSRLNKDITENFRVIKFTDLNGSNCLPIIPDRLFYIESDKNYVKIIFLSETGERNEQKLRTTLSRLQEQLSPNDFVVKTHRAFLVNLKNIAKVNGNSSTGYRLTFFQIPDTVPVSRSFSQKIFQHINAFYP